jgi:hypothetical protein
MISCTLSENVNNESVGLVIYPVALVDITIRVPELALSIRLVELSGIIELDTD